MCGPVDRIRSSLVVTETLLACETKQARPSLPVKLLDTIWSVVDKCAVRIGVSMSELCEWSSL